MSAPPSDAERDQLEARCEARFDALSIDAITVRHAPVYTVEAARDVRRGLADERLDIERDRHVKNLFLCDRKKRRFVLVTVPETRRVDLSSLAALLGERALRFANAGHLAAHLAVEAGAVTPLAVLHDLEGRVELVVDRALHPEHCPPPTRIWVHPLHNAATTALLAADLARVLTAADHPPRWLDVPGHAS